MFKDNLEGKTHSCDHETPNPSGICDVCLGKPTIQEKMFSRIEKELAFLGMPYYDAEPIIKKIVLEWGEERYQEGRAMKESTEKLVAESRQQARDEGYQEGVLDGRDGQIDAVDMALESYRKELIDKIEKGNFYVATDEIIKLIN